MSAYKFNCPHCSQSLEAPQEILGGTTECPTCSGAIQLPEPESAPALTIKRPLNPVVDPPIQRTFSQEHQTMMPSNQKTFRKALIIGGSCFLVFIILIKSSQLISSLFGPAVLSNDPRGGAERIYQLSGDAAISEARKLMVGTWTYTGSELKALGRSLWLRWVINEDGTMDEYLAAASDDDWKQPTKCQWEIITGKYSDTGKRYYAFHIKGNATQAIIGRNGDVIYGLGDDYLMMKKGDKFPFSK